MTVSMNFNQDLNSSDVANEMDTEGCIQCQMGSKLVLFITGHCHWMCDYCPLSETRREIDYMYANERRVDIGDWNAVIEEARAMNATGAGITGGDPVMARERVLEGIKILKKEFGDDFGSFLILKDKKHLKLILNTNSVVDAKKICNFSKKNNINCLIIY